MRANTPSLFPWVNQCGDGTEWVARAGSPYAVPELYSVKGTTGNAVAMAQAQLTGYESWLGKSERFGLTHWPLVGIGDGGGIPNINSTSLVRFQAYSAVAYGAKGIMYGTFKHSPSEPVLGPIPNAASFNHWLHH